MAPAAVSATASKDRGETTRQHILDVAALHFAEHGYRGISLNEIVRSTGLTKGAFYFHFPSKEALAIEVFRAKQEQWIARTTTAVAAEARAIDQLNAMLDCGCDIYEDDASARVVGRLCVELSREKDLAAQMTEHLTAWFEIVSRLVERAQQEGDVRPELDARTIGETIVSAFIGVEQVSDALTGLRDLRRRMENLRAFVMSAIRPCP
jgi:AcrR family transcriptional regulator